MPPHPCSRCHNARAQILRPKNHCRLCAPCFLHTFELETAQTILDNQLFQRGEKIAIGASGGKDSTVLAAVLDTLNKRYDWGLQLMLLSIDEGITGYRDHSLEAVKKHSAQLGLPLTILSYEELYGWSMDAVVAQVGKKGNCTYCGVFRRQALDRGAARLGVRHVVTGHNADDVAETVVMNLLRGDLARLGRGTAVVTRSPGMVEKETLKHSSRAGDTDVEAVSFTEVKRSKPLIHAYEREIVLYAHHKRLEYFSTECIYSPEAFRGSARTLIKNLERIRPESILDVVRSGVDIARMVPDSDAAAAAAAQQRNHEARGPSAKMQLEEEAEEGGCGNTSGRSSGGEMAGMEKKLREDERALENCTETEITFPSHATNGQRHDREPDRGSGMVTRPNQVRHTDSSMTMPLRTKQERKGNGTAGTKQRLGQCERCGYLSSQMVCKACVLLEGLNKARPLTGIEVGGRMD